MGIINITMFAAPFAYGAGYGAYGYGMPYGGYGLGWFNQKGGQHGMPHQQNQQLMELHGGMPGANGLANQNTYMHSDVTGVSSVSNPFFGTAGAARTTFPGVP